MGLDGTDGYTSVMSLSFRAVAVRTLYLSRRGCM